MAQPLPSKHQLGRDTIGMDCIFRGHLQNGVAEFVGYDFICIEMQDPVVTAASNIQHQSRECLDPPQPPLPADQYVLQVPAAEADNLGAKPVARFANGIEIASATLDGDRLAAALEVEVR